MFTLIQKLTMMKTITTTINCRNDDKPTLRYKKGLVWYHKLLPMESEMKIIGCTHFGGDNNGRQQKQQ